jgi:hypothetical protein
MVFRGILVSQPAPWLNSVDLEAHFGRTDDVRKP